MANEKDISELEDENLEAIEAEETDEGLEEETEELEERNKANKFKKDLYVAKKGVEHATKNLGFSPKDHVSMSSAFGHDKPTERDNMKALLKDYKRRGRKSVKEEAELDEAAIKFHYEGPKGAAHIKKDPETGEHVVRFWKKTDSGLKRHEAADYFTDDKSDAHGTAKKMVNEETTASNSLKPNSMPSDPMSKVGIMNSMMGMMNGMKQEDLTKFFQATMAQFGPNKEYGVGDNSAKNRASVAMKEDLESIFDGSELSEEFKTATTTLFEAALSARVIAETARLEEEYEAALQEEVAAISEELVSNLDAYLSYAVDNFMKENEVAIESSLRNELTEEFIDGLKNLFAEHYINIPEDKVDALEALAEKVEDLESSLHEAITENTELREALMVESAKNVFEELSADLAMTQQEKFAALAEGIEFDGDVETYAKKLSIIKESYFNKESKNYSSNIIEESFEEPSNGTVIADPQVNRYVQAIARTVKK